MKDLKHSVKGITIAVVLAGASALLAEEDRDCDGEIVCESERGRLSVRCDGATLTSWKPASPGFDGDVFFMPAKTPWVIREFPADGKPHRLDDPGRKRTISISASGNDTWCVWNPGTERTPLCETLAPDEWHHFYCLEPVMRTALTLAPGESRTHTMTLRVGTRKSPAGESGGPCKGADGGLACRAGT